MTTIRTDWFQNGVHCVEVRDGIDGVLVLNASVVNDTDDVIDTTDGGVVVSVVDRRTSANLSYDLWGSTFWSTAGTYRVTYSWTDPVDPAQSPAPLVVTLLIVDTADGFQIDSDGVLVISAPDFENESLMRYRRARQSTMMALDPDGGTVDETNDGFPTRFRVEGNPHYTLQVPVFTNFNVTEVIFGDGVTHLGSYTFYDNDNLVGTLALPNTLEFVGYNTIMYCDGIEHLTFFETGLTKKRSLVDLPREFATENDGLKTVNLSSMTSLTGITGDYCFYGNLTLETVTLPPTVVTLGYWTFNLNPALHTVNLENVKHFGEDSFYECDNMRVFDMRSMESAHEYSLYTELTDPPQVVTLQTTDQLVLLVGPEDDEYSNQFTARTFHFITGYTEEDLASFSDTYSLWTLVPSLASSPIVSASSGGDPYVFPLVGPVYKLPNSEEVYRLYQDDHVVINAMVSIASADIQAEIMRAVAGSYGHNYQPVAAEAYFYSHIFVGSRTTDDKVNIDIEQKQYLVTGTTNMFRVEPQEVSKDSLSYDIPVRWGQDTCLTISYSRNPQIRNGLRLSGRKASLASGTGLLTRNYRPKFFRLSTLHNTAPVSIPRKCVRPLTKRGIRGHNEVLLTF